MKQLKIILCVLLCAVMLPAAALAAPRMPAERGVVTDDADVLGAQTIADVGEYADKLEDETDIELHVVTVHFLDGVDAQTYADGLFAKWDLGQDDMLLLIAAGEDSCATAMGKDVANELGETNARNLMYTSSDFGALVRAQQYDAAVGCYFTAFNALVEKQTGERIRLGNLFGAYAQQPQATPAVSFDGSQLWTDVMNAITTRSDDYESERAGRVKERNGLSAGGWIVLVILIAIVFGHKKDGASQRRNGCGCSPLSWLFGLLGINVLAGLFDKN